MPNTAADQHWDPEAVLYDLSSLHMSVWMRALHYVVRRVYRRTTEHL